tara:strand:+ start:3377 stop:4579 length:1203 start_codon:yes stop_codon:yes gene_type:complete
MVVSLGAIQKHLAAVGEEPVLQEQKKKQEEALEKFKSLDFSALSPSAIKAEIEAASEEITKQVDIGIEKAKELQPQLESMTEKMMEAINDPSLQDSLQSLTDNLQIQPPGGGLPDIGGGLDIGTSSFGGFDIGSALKVADVKLGEVGVNGFDSVLPDINLGGATGINGGGTGALGFEIPGGLPTSLTSGITDAFGSLDKLPTNLTEIGTGGLENPFKTFGNINIKDAFDSDGSPIKEIVKKGVPSIVPRFDSKAEVPPPTIDITFPTDQTTFKLPKIFEVSSDTQGAQLKIDSVIQSINVEELEKTAEEMRVKLLDVGKQLQPQLESAAEELQTGLATTATNLQKVIGNRIDFDIPVKASGVFGIVEIAESGDPDQLPDFAKDLLSTAQELDASLGGTDT